MTKDDYSNWLLKELTKEEISFVNEAIYFAPDHIDYYIKYHEADYKWCKDYILKHRHLLKEQV